MGQSEGSAEAGQIQGQMVRQQDELFRLGSPGISLALKDMLKDLGKAGQEPDSIKKQFDEAKAFADKQFRSEEAASPLTLAQRMKETGYRGDSRALDAASSETLFKLEGMRRGNARALQQQETMAGMQQRDFDLSQILNIGYGSTQGAFAGQSNALNLASYGTRNPWGSALSGAVGGASAGSAFGPYGAAVGGILGGAAGYFS